MAATVIQDEDLEQQEQPARPRRDSKKWEREAGLKHLLYVILVLVLAAAGYAAWMWYSITYPYQGFPREGVFVEVPHGASRRYVGYLLKQNGVVRSKLAFEIYARRHLKRTLHAA